MTLPETLDIVCPLCGEQTGQTFLKKPTGFQVYVCPKCRIGQTFPYPEESNGQEYYTDSFEYYVNHYENRRELWYSYMSTLLNFAKPHVSSGELLDIGCNQGYLLEVAQKRGFVTTGIDPSPAATRFARERLNLNVVQGHFPVKELEHKAFDLITINHVLEHVPEPINFLAQVKKQLKPGGVVVIASPALSGIVPNLIGWRWVGFQPTQHIWQLAPQNVAQMCERAGLQVLQAKSNSLGYVPGHPKETIKFVLGKLGEITNKGDQLIVIATNKA
jgi:2-polyprenyl-3-methyl-5-hydroxy-6-metoxy-1,4-benzoquinol methylase